MICKTLLAAAIGSMIAITAASANDAARFELSNISGQPIDTIQVSPVSSGNWGPDLLGNRVLRNNGAVVVTPSASGCRFDVRVIYHDASKESFRNLDLCRTARIAFANSRDYVRN